MFQDTVLLIAYVENSQFTTNLPPIFKNERKSALHDNRNAPAIFAGAFLHH